MNFSLTTTGGLYDNYEKERLSTLGFVFKDRRLDPKAINPSTGKITYEDKPWSKCEPESLTIAFNSLEELLAFSAEWGPLVLHSREVVGDRFTSDNHHIEIYDDCRE